MTGNQIKGKGFRGALRYNLEKVDKGVAEILDHSFASTSERTIMKEIQMVKVLRPNLQKYFYHTSINFPPGEDLPNDKVKQIGLDYLESNGFTMHQFIMFRHYDADHPHLHILVNRIGYDGSLVSDSNDFSRSEKVLRGLEKKYKLTQVMPSKDAKVRAITKDELEMIKRTNAPSYKLKLQNTIRKILQDKPGLTTEEFINALLNNKVNVLFNQASTGYVSGISYGYDGMIFKGAKLGNDFKWGSIKNKINYDQERDREVIKQINAKVKSGNGDTKVTPTQKADSRFRKTPELSRNLIPTSLVDGHPLADLIRADHQPDIDIEKVLKLGKKKKRRKGLRR
jgi:hypothetical protein